MAQQGAAVFHQVVQMQGFLEAFRGQGLVHQLRSRVGGLTNGQRDTGGRRFFHGLLPEREGLDSENTR